MTFTVQSLIVLQILAVATLSHSTLNSKTGHCNPVGENPLCAIDVWVRDKAANRLTFLWVPPASEEVKKQGERIEQLGKKNRALEQKLEWFNLEGLAKKNGFHVLSGLDETLFGKYRDNQCSNEQRTEKRALPSASTSSATSVNCSLQRIMER